MINPPGWSDDEPCPNCGSWDITEWEIRVGAVACRMAWECRDCGYLAAWRLPAQHLEGGETA